MIFDNFFREKKCMVLLGLLELFFALRIGLYLELILHSNLNVFDGSAKSLQKK